MKPEGYYVEVPRGNDTHGWDYEPMRLVNFYKPTRRWVQVLKEAREDPVTMFKTKTDARNAVRRTRSNDLGNNRALRYLRIRTLTLSPKAIMWRKLL